MVELSMRIAHICPYYSPAIGGVKQVVEELAKRQHKKGHEVHVFTSDWDKNNRIPIEDEIIDNVYVHRCRHYLRVGDFSTIWPGVYNKLLKLKPDVIHAHVTGHLHTFLAMKAAKKLNVPIIITPHCPWESNRSKAATIANIVSYKIFPVLKYADAVIAITPWEHKFLLAEGTNKDKIHTIPNGMGKGFFTKITPNKFKEKHNIKESDDIVLFFGRLNYTKNPQMFIDIAEKILRDKDDVTFVICGPDEGELEDVKRMISKLNTKKILLLPPTRDRKDIIEMYQASNIYILPSKREGLPLTLFEAYASGLPVVGSAVNGVPYELKDGVNGYLCEPNDRSKFISSIVSLLKDKGIRDNIINNNLEKAKNFDWDLIAEQTTDIYRNEKAKKNPKK